MELDARHLPIVEGRELVGIVTAHDLRSFMHAAHVSGTPTVDPQLRQAIGRVFVQEPVFVYRDTELGGVARLMLETKLDAVGVVSRESRELVGIVTTIDVLRACQLLL